ncbi:MAG TPA: hypothetical protein VIE65_15340 [Methylobacter sp.]|jgi:hypothetical protein
MIPLIGYSKYSAANDHKWDYIWVADRKYIDNTAAVSMWLPLKGNLAWVASGSQRPTWALDVGSKNRGSITFNGINQCMTCEPLAQYITNWQEYTIGVFCKLLTSPITANLAPVTFSLSTDNNSGVAIQTSSQATDQPKGWMLVQQTSDGSLNLEILPTPADNNWNTLFFSTIRTIQDGVPAYSVLSATQNLIDTATINNVPIRYDQKPLNLDRSTLCAFRGKTLNAFYNYKIRAVCLAKRQLATSGGTSGPSMRSCSTNFYREL